MPAIHIKLYHLCLSYGGIWHYTAIRTAANSSVIDNCSKEDNINVMYLKEPFAAVG